MRLYMMMLSVGSLVAGLEAHAQNHQAGHEGPIAAIRKLGGEVFVSSNKPGAQVTVVLTGARRPADCLPYLDDVRNLHTCDL